MAPTYFFDSHGGLWVTCSCEDPRAKAMGPYGCAREVGDPSEAGLQVPEGRSAYGVAEEEGRIRFAQEAHEWDLLEPPPTRAYAAHASDHDEVTLEFLGWDDPNAGHRMTPAAGPQMVRRARVPGARGRVTARTFWAVTDEAAWQQVERLARTPLAPRFRP